ncbi:MAG: DUF3035 domain-containing protein [Alphaproteobacteria bacterium]|nr:DUF3035 domain-containing protein [Alphaproteobacteria bacterium]
MTFSTLKLGLIAGLGALALSGCSGFSDAIGSSKYPPDEFAVIASSPLIIPPDYNLRPPGVNRPEAQQIDPSQMALRALFPDQSIQYAEPSEGERNLSRQAGVNEANRDAGSELSPAPSVTRKGAFTEDILFGDEMDSGSEVLIEQGGSDSLEP